MSLDVGAKKYLRETIELFVDLIETVAEEENKTNPIQYRNDYVKFVITYIDQIVINWRVGVEYYLNFYDVFPSDGKCDEFKNIYFIGTAISQKLQDGGISDLAKFQQIAVMKLLDYRLHKDANTRRPELSFRIRQSINFNKIDEDLGRFGWYMIYKCLFNAAMDAKKAAAKSQKKKPVAAKKATKPKLTVVKTSTKAKK